MDSQQPQPIEDIAGDLKQLMQALNPLLREYLEEGKYIPVARMLASKYSLGPVQSNVLEKGLVFLLTGIDNPSEFGDLLKSEGEISDDVVRSIMTDVNVEVFLPLQEEMKRAENAPVAPAALPTPPAPVRPAAAFVAPDPASRSYAPPLQSPRYPVQGADLVASRPAPTTPARPTAPGVIREGQRFVPPRPPVALVEGGKPSIPSTNPGLREVMTNLKMLEDHEEPHIDLHNGVPANLPRVVTAPVATPLPAQEAPVAPKPASVPMVPITSYTKDPYREPIDEQ